MTNRPAGIKGTAVQRSCEETPSNELCTKVVQSAEYSQASGRNELTRFAIIC